MTDAQIELLSTLDVATATGVSVSTVTRWVNSGQLVPIYKGPGVRGAYMFDKSAVDKMKEEHHEDD